MTEREAALEQALGAVVAVARQPGISMTLLAKAKTEILFQAPESEAAKQQALEAIREIELAAQGSIVIVEAENADMETIRDAVIRAAEEHGETGALDRLKHEPSHGAGTVVFNIQGENVFYSQVYAECEVFPALRSEGRYFRLKEVKTTARGR